MKGGRGHCADRELNQESLKSVLDYNQESGVFTWKVLAASHLPPGTRAGYRMPSHGKFYLWITVFGRQMPAHRLAFLYMNGSLPLCEVDHIDGCGENNAFKNLRLVTRAENCKNRRLGANNKSGVPGVMWVDRRQRWETRININGKQKTIRTTKDFFEAVCARKSAELLHGYHDNHGSRRPL